MNKLLIIGEFPAPYRVEVFSDLAKHWPSKVYFEYQQDEKRTAEWLSRVSVDCNILDNPTAKKEFKQDIKKLKSYDAVILYNNCLKNAIILELFCKLKRVPYFINCDGCNDIEESNPLKENDKMLFDAGSSWVFCWWPVCSEIF